MRRPRSPGILPLHWRDAHATQPCSLVPVPPGRPGPWLEQRRHEAGSDVLALAGAFDLERPLARALEKCRNHAIDPQLREACQVPELFERIELRLRVEEVPSLPSCGVKSTPRAIRGDDTHHDPAFGLRHAGRFSEKPLRIVGEAERHDHEDRSELTILEGRGLPHRPKCPDPTPLGVPEDSRRRVDPEVDPQGIGEAPGSHTDLQPGPREVPAHLAQAQQLRRK